MSDTHITTLTTTSFSRNDAFSYLLIGSSGNNRLQALRELGAYYLETSVQSLDNSPDFHLIEDEYGIETVRNVIKIFSLKPYTSRKKVVGIREAQNLSIPAQNALLKTLEEPSQDSIIILTAENEKQLLPTILSRCFCINLKAEKGDVKKPLYSEESLAVLNDFLPMNPAQRLLFIQNTLKDDAGITALLESWLLILQSWLLSRITKSVHTSGVDGDIIKLSQALRAIQQTQLLISQNVNVRLSLDYLALNLPAIYFEKETP